MELRQINRNYGFGNFKFIFEYKNYDHSYYESLLENGNYEKMKEIYIPYCEDRLHVTATYLFFTKYIFPILFLFTFFLFPKNELFQLIIPSSGVLISFIANRILNRLWRIRCQIYSFEITAINDFMSKKYGGKFDSDFDRLGEMYMNGEFS